MNGWIKEIQKVTKMSRDPASGTAIQEINFWLSMERALEKIDEQLKSDQISKYELEKGGSICNALKRRQVVWLVALGPLPCTCIVPTCFV